MMKLLLFIVPLAFHAIGYSDNWIEAVDLIFTESVWYKERTIIPNSIRSKVLVLTGAFSPNIAKCIWASSILLVGRPLRCSVVNKLSSPALGSRSRRYLPKQHSQPACRFNTSGFSSVSAPHLQHFVWQIWSLRSFLKHTKLWMIDPAV